MLKALPRYSVLLDDEASGEGGNKRRPMSTENVESMMDMDAFRGRNQAVGFAAPSRKRIDDGIWDHVMWVFHWNMRHGFRAYEMIEVGPVDNRVRRPKFRFRVESVPHLETLYPDVEAAYSKAKEDHMFGTGDADDGRDFLEDVARAKSVLRQVLRK